MLVIRHLNLYIHSKVINSLDEDKSTRLEVDHSGTFIYWMLPKSISHTTNS